MRNALQALKKYGYRASVMNAFEFSPANESIRLQSFLDAQNIRPTRGLDGTVATLASHFWVALRAIREARPLIAMEDDTYAIRAWDVPPSAYKVRVISFLLQQLPLRLLRLMYPPRRITIFSASTAGSTKATTAGGILLAKIPTSYTFTLVPGESATAETHFSSPATDRR